MTQKQESMDTSCDICNRKMQVPIRNERILGFWMNCLAVQDSYLAQPNRDELSANR